MTASEIIMKRDDPNIAWGFRMTGGADLGTPFYVVKVLGRGHAERAGLTVGDMVYAINHQYINNYSHKEAQNAILHTGNTLILNIRRGPVSGRGTPLPEYVDPLMGIAAPPPTPRPKPVPLPPYEPPVIVKEPTPPESEEEEDEGGEDTAAAFKVKINPKGRIAAIEELPVTPPPSRSSSRCRSRSRSASRDRRSSSKRGSTFSQHQGSNSGMNGIPGPGEAFTYSKEVLTQYKTVLTAGDQSGGQTSEMINESFVIHGGSDQKMEDVLSPDDIERDIFEEKMEEQKITELLTGEAELLDQGVVGINFQKIIPKTDFIKESNVFKELQDQCIKKEEPEEVQLQKDPTKRFSTFLQTPKRPIPKPKTNPTPEDFTWKKRLPSLFPEIPKPQSPLLQQTQIMQTTEHEEINKSFTTWSESVNRAEDMAVQELKIKEEQIDDEKKLAEAGEDSPIITLRESTENILEERVHFENESDDTREDFSSVKDGEREDCSSIKEASIHTENGEMEKTILSSEQNHIELKTKTEYKSEFDKQLDEVQKQIEAIQDLPNVLQANLMALKEQLTKIVEARATADQTEEVSSEKRDSVHSQLKWKIDVTVEENKECVVEESNKEETVTDRNQYEEVNDNIELEYEPINTNQNGVDEPSDSPRNENHEENNNFESTVSKPAMIRNFPCNNALRPIVLPGGRKWYKPRDAYNEDFIAETIINQSEVLVGTTIGLNFRKYEPPKFDAANSAVFRLIQELENRCFNDTGLPIEGRPEKLLAEEDYFPPISKRHFFAARLAEQNNENIEKILQDSNEEVILV